MDMMKSQPNYWKIAAPFISNFPDKLKYSIINPLYKKSNKRDGNNYGPISLLTSFSKILEKVIQIRFAQKQNYK